MVQVKWKKNYLDSDGKCNIKKNGVVCGQELSKTAYVVRRHIERIHPELYKTITGHDAGTQNDALTDLATFIGTTTAPIDYLRNKAFKVSVYL